MATPIECPDCGIEIDPRGLSAHQGGRRCTALLQEDEAIALGYERLKYQWTHIVKKCGVPCLPFYSDFRRGSQRHPGVLVREWWVPPWVIAFFDKYYVYGLLTFTGPYRLSWHQTRKLFRHVARNQGYL